MGNISFNQLNQKLRDEKFFIVDRKVFNLYESKLDALAGKYLYIIDEPEAHKTFEGLEGLIAFLLENKISRRDRLVAIGGGALSDLAGFAASIVLRGIDWVCVPTTLLSLIDASIGGKTGINTGFGKNLVGAFHCPKDTFIVLNFLETLPAEELASGKGELLKYAFLDAKVFEAVKAKMSLEKIILMCRDVKERIVEKDFKESGERAKLNLGHTFGHVFERLEKIPHGIAVAMGLEVVLDLYVPELSEDFEQLKDLMDIEYSLPHGLDKNEFWSHFSRDKKQSGDGCLTMVIPESVGNARLKNLSIESVKNQIEIHEKHQHLFR